MAKKATRSSIIHDYKFLGREPEVNGKLISSVVDLTTNYNWYNYFHNTDDAKRFLNDYCKANNISVDLEKHNNNTFGWVARLLTRGAIFDESVMNRFNDYLKTMRVTRPAVKEATTVRVNNVHNVIMEFIANIDEQIDIRETDFSMYQFLRSNNVGPNYVKMIRDHYTPMFEEIQAAYNKTDAQLVEGYSHYSRKELKALVEFYQGMITDCDTFANNVKVEKKSRTPRKPRKRKEKSVETIMKHFTYMERFDEMKLVSEAPEKIIGAEAVYLFDTTYNKLTMLVAEKGKTLNIHRSSISNYDENESICKRIGRKTQETIAHLMASTKRSRPKYMKGLKGDVKVSNRVSDRVIIVKIDK